MVYFVTSFKYFLKYHFLNEAYSSASLKISASLSGLLMSFALLQFSLKAFTILCLVTYLLIVFTIFCLFSVFRVFVCASHPPASKTVLGSY